MAIVAIATLLTALVVSLIVVRVATVALVLTGVSHEVARFQARSAFSNTGFTTPEAQLVMEHPVRRRIVLVLMLWGNAGMVTVISALILSFTGIAANEGDVSRAIIVRLLLLGLGLFLVWAFANSKWVDAWLSKLITRALKRFTELRVLDYVQLLRLSGGFAVANVRVSSEGSLDGKSLTELRLSDRGVLVLGIERDNGEYVGAPTGRSVLQAGDNLLVYCPDSLLKEIEPSH